MKRILFTTFLGLMGIVTFGQQSASDAESKKILDALSKKTKAYTTIKVDFKSKTTKGTENLGENTGTLTVKDKKYHYKEGVNEVYCDGRTIWNYTGEDNTCYVDDVSEEGEDGSNLDPSKIFTIWEEGFKSKYEGEKTVSGKKIQTIKLYPLDPKDKPVHTIILEIDKVKQELTKVTIKGKDGITSTYTVIKLTTNTTIEDSKFRFRESKYPEVVIID